MTYKPTKPRKHERIRTRVVTSSRVPTVPPGKHQAQYRDPDKRLWFDIGDPCDTEEEARAKTRPVERRT